MNVKTNTLCTLLLLLGAITITSAQTSDIVSPITSGNTVTQWLDSQQQTDSVFQSDLLTPSNGQSELVKTYVPVVDNALFYDLQLEELSDIWNASPSLLSIKLPTPSGYFELSLAQVDLSDGEITIATIDDEQLSHQVAGKFYRGTVKNNKQSIVAMSVFKDEIRLMISDDSGNYVLGQINDKPNTYIFYNDKYLKGTRYFECEVPPPTGKELDQLQRHIEEGSKSGSFNRCVEVFIECDYAMYIYNDADINAVGRYIAGLFNEVATLYQNDQITVKISKIVVWNREDQYAGYDNTYDLLEAYKVGRSSFDGDLAHFITKREIGGGRAVISGLCEEFPHAVSGISQFYRSVPTYSWDVYVFAHEMGHNFGSYHTHRCYWGANRKQIDDCGNLYQYNNEENPEGNSCFNINYPIIPSTGGTIMSYCHQNDVGINFNKGFSRLPGNVMRGRFNAACDLTCEDEQPQKPNLTCGGTGTLTVEGNKINISNFTIKNDGSGRAGQSHVGYYLSTNTTISTSDILIGEDDVRALNPGEISTENFTITLTNISEEEYYVGMIVDYKEEVGETDGNDNECYFATPKINITTGKPNLICEGSGRLEVNGNTIKLSNFTVKNIGATQAGASYVGYYLSTNTTITDQDIFIGEDYVGSLNSGSSSTESFEKILSNIASGTYYFGAIVDYKNEVTETTGTDNDCYFSSPRIIITANTGKPNLTCSGEGSLSTNNFIDATNLGIKNEGTTRANVSRVGYFLSKDASVSSDDIFIGDDHVSALDPGETSYESFQLTDIPQGTYVPNGTYYFLIIADYLNRVNEGDETDNGCYFSSPKIVISGTSNLPNIVCDGLGSARLDNGQLLISNLRIKNSGRGNAASSRVAYYLSTDQTITSSDIFIGDDYVASLNSGRTSTEGITVDVSSLGLSTGTYYIGVLLDYRNNVNESVESDNDCLYSNTIRIENNNADCKCTSSFASSICDDFDDYRTGYIGPQSSCWTTWSGNEGGTQDGIVGRTEDGNQYVYFVGGEGGGPQDVVLKLGNRTSGKYEYQFSLFIYTGYKGYYNILHEFNTGGSDNEWAQEVYFDGGGRGRLQINNGYVGFSYQEQKWLTVYQQFDISNNTTSLFIDGQRVHTWPFNYTSTSRNGSRKIAASNFYPVDNNYTFFVDNLRFDRVNNFVLPSNVEGRTSTYLPVANEQVTFSTNENTKVQLNPNPSTGTFELLYIGLVEAGTIVEIIDLTGRLIRQEDLAATMSFDLSQEAAGIYYVRVATPTATTIHPIVLIE
jgi:hypothetical protein